MIEWIGEGSEKDLSKKIFGFFVWLLVDGVIIYGDGNFGRRKVFKGKYWV